MSDLTGVEAMFILLGRRYDPEDCPTRFNPHHDKTGKFASADGFGAGALHGSEALRAVEYKPSSDSVRDSLTDYGGEGPNSYQRVNDGLRGGPAFGTQGLTAGQQGVVRDLDKAMAESPGAPADLIVHRNVSPRTFGLTVDQIAKGDLTGLTWRDQGFVSTAAKPYDSRTSITLRIRVPKGTRALSFSEKDREGGGGLDLDEVLLDRGLKFRVVADHGAGSSGRNLDVEVIPG